MNIKRLEELKKSQEDWLYDHHWVKTVFSYSWTFTLSTLSALCFALGFNTFMDVGSVAIANWGGKLVSGGMSGISQVITLIFNLCGFFPDTHTAYSILYFILNIPIFFLAWFGIGKKFSVFTLINVLEVSLFVKFMTITYIPMLENIATFVNENGGLFARAFFAGVFTGLSSAIAFKGDISAGGIDVVAYYIGLKKSTTVGKYSAVINGLTVSLFCLFTCVEASFKQDATGKAIGSMLYSFIYMLVATTVVDTINIRNKKLKIDIITTNKELGSVLIATIPHGATLIQGEGVYTGAPRYIITMVVSSYEVSKVIKLIKREDPQSFVEVMPLSQVYGRFYRKPVK